jgi:hypothetical protein
VPSAAFLSRAFPFRGGRALSRSIFSALRSLSSLLTLPTPFFSLSLPLLTEGAFILDLGEQFCSCNLKGWSFLLKETGSRSWQLVFERVYVLSFKRSLSSLSARPFRIVAAIFNGAR